MSMLTYLEEDDQVAVPADGFLLFEDDEGRLTIWRRQQPRVAMTERQDGRAG